MLASKSPCRNASRRRRSKSRSLEAIYHDQRPQGVDHADWSTVFDAFVVEWGRSLAADAVQRLARPQASAA